MGISPFSKHPERMQQVLADFRSRCWLKPQTGECLVPQVSQKGIGMIIRWSPCNSTGWITCWPMPCAPQREHWWVNGYRPGFNSPYDSGPRLQTPIAISLVLGADDSLCSTIAIWGIVTIIIADYSWLISLNMNHNNHHERSGTTWPHRWSLTIIDLFQFFHENNVKEITTTRCERVDGCVSRHQCLLELTSCWYWHLAKQQNYSSWRKRSFDFQNSSNNGERLCERQTFSSRKNQRLLMANN